MILNNLALNMFYEYSTKQRVQWGVVGALCVQASMPHSKSVEWSSVFFQMGWLEGKP